MRLAPDSRAAQAMPRWAVVRLALGLAQMTGAVTAFLFLVQTGLSSWTLGVATVTGVLTTVSVLLFGIRLPPDA